MTGSFIARHWAVVRGLIGTFLSESALGAGCVRALAGSAATPQGMGRQAGGPSTWIWPGRSPISVRRSLPSARMVYSP